MKSVFTKINDFLIPPTETFRYGPYVWLVYLSIFFTSLYIGSRGTHPYLISAIAVIVFLAVYFNAYWASSRQVKLNILLILIIGTILSTITPGSNVFYVYAGAFCCRLANAKAAFIGLFFIVVWIGVSSWLLNLNAFFYIPAILFTLLIGGVNIYQWEMDKKRKELILTQQEVRDLAKTAERERIARDLHDLIGHTFSVITLKAELAGKLIDKDLAKAKQEVTELENISRDALKQVREVVTGYRTSDLNTELAHAKYVLESNDIHFKYRIDDLTISDTVNKELAIILKELVTNVLKHAKATKVIVEINQLENHAQMTLSDDGVGISDNPNKGFGLQGIKERIDRLSGRLTLNSNQGAEFVIEVPLKE